MDQLLQHAVAREAYQRLVSPPTTRPRPARRPRSAVRPHSLMLRLLRAETRLYLRDVPSAIFALLVPAVVLVCAGLVIPGMRARLSGGAWDGLTMIQVYTPAVLTMAVATPALSTLPMIVANYREHGVLRRLSTTPTQPSAVLAAQVVINLAAFLVAGTIALVVAATVFDSPLPRQSPTAVLALLLGALAMFGLGMLVAARARTGTAATVIAYGPTVDVALNAAAAAAEEGLELEVVDLRSLSPIDWEPLEASLRKTGRAIVVHEAQGTLGMGSELAARLSERCFYSLEAPVLRVTGYDVPYPASRLEDDYLPNLDRVLDAVDRSLEY